MDDVQWDTGRPADAGHGIRILRLRPGSAQQVYLLDELIGVWLHWVEGSSLPCLGTGCPYHHVRSYRRWYGPAMAPTRMDPETGRRQWERVILECLDAGAALLEGRNCRGLLLELSRNKGGYSPTIVRVAEQQYDREPPEPFDVRPLLKRIWAVTGSGAAQPRPAKGIDLDPETLPFRRQAT